MLFLIFQDWVGDAFGSGREWIVTNLGWFFILGVTVWLVFLIWVAISRYGRLRLGDDDDKPAYSNLSWFAMLFAGGIGTVLMFWGVAEPISHFSNPPFEGVQPYSAEAAEDAMSISLYHLSLHTWAISVKPHDVAVVGVRGFGLAGYQYLRMLFGAQTTKPDVHVKRFVSQALGRKVGAKDALALLEQASAQAGLPLRAVDGVIWQEQSQKG